MVVGILLSVVYQALRPKQLENIANDTKKQILASARLTPEKGENISSLFDRHIVSSYLVDASGNRVDNGENPFDINVAIEFKKPIDKRLLPVFECRTDNGLKYIVPVYGAGLWARFGDILLLIIMGTQSTELISDMKEKPRVWVQK